LQQPPRVPRRRFVIMQMSTAASRKVSASKSSSAFHLITLAGVVSISTGVGGVQRNGSPLPLVNLKYVSCSLVALVLWSVMVACGGKEDRQCSRDTVATAATSVTSATLECLHDRLGPSAVPGTGFCQHGRNVSPRRPIGIHVGVPTARLQKCRPEAAAHFTADQVPTACCRPVTVRRQAWTKTAAGTETGDALAWKYRHGIIVILAVCKAATGSSPCT
jgi:hypothetical protein